ncbi:hypothetical protein Pcinc_037700 [Petrolisthes cinctipes]|uniref:Uncharacterized protein n=1 Tax=Petrolisthes cinctipes TaxID=88211 RepID=A0AAE1BS15_PETCI|nr:hypothetical protein Pcinc_037700 [Petrolisthes cinctipes]
MRENREHEKQREKEEQKEWEAESVYERKNKYFRSDCREGEKNEKEMKTWENGKHREKEGEEKRKRSERQKLNLRKGKYACHVPEGLGEDINKPVNGPTTVTRVTLCAC